MKKFIISLCFIFLYLFSNLVIFAEQYQKLDICELPQYKEIESPLEEGFLVGTLIKIPYGYTPIENIAIGDAVIDAQGNVTEVVAITKRFIDKHIKIILHNTVVCLGNDQLLHFDTNSAWVKACEVPDIEYIYGFSILYALTTNSHTLCVTSCDISAHNVTAVLGAMGTGLGYITIGNPIIAVLGSVTVALAVVAYNAQQEYAQKHWDKDVHFDMPDTIILADRFYYVSRKNDLEKIREELLTVKNDVEKIHGLYSGCFTYQFLHNHTYDFPKNIALPTIDREKQLSDEHKNQLRKMREHELRLLEKQIEDMQLLLALHVNQLITNLEQALCAYDNNMPNISSAIATWNNGALSYDNALQAYKYDLLREYLVWNIGNTINELKVIIDYYNNCKNVCIRKSTNITVALESLAPEINKKRQWLDNEINIVRKNIAISEQYFSNHCIPVASFKNEVKKEFEKERKKREVQVLVGVENRLSGSNSSGGPKKNDDEEEKEDESKKDFWKNLKSRSDKNARSMRFGKMYRDPITKLWWSKDLAGHGGSSYKVFKETAKEFELIYDAAKDGARMLSKHKGPVGLFIPYKEVIFRT